jgi:hypothetical protein
VDELEIPKVGDEMYHLEAGWVRIAAVRYWPVVYCECVTERGGRFSAVLSALWANETGFWDLEAA